MAPLGWYYGLWLVGWQELARERALSVWHAGTTGPNRDLAGPGVVAAGETGPTVVCTAATTTGNSCDAV
jgi:hypothetical protein